ncbi:hypothetical protein B0H19DRAFT_1247396 [Mycena capillaripes]|nr:hypothetical protein B0H19DRAFT_1247396 [Mycena capillaripes]
MVLDLELPCACLRFGSSYNRHANGLSSKFPPFRMKVVVETTNGVIGILTPIEPHRKRNLCPPASSFGFDEEGAGHLVPALLERFGWQWSLMRALDTRAVTVLPPLLRRTPSKSIDIEVETPGGHSSVPLEHTSIGLLAALICFGVHGPAMSPALKAAILRGEGPSDVQGHRGAVAAGPHFQGPGGHDAHCSGGVKGNALPEQALVHAALNHRITTQSSVDATLSCDAALIMELAARFNLSITEYGELLTAPGASLLGTLSLHAPPTLKSAPLILCDASLFRLLAGSIRAVFQAVRKGGMDVVVTLGGTAADEWWLGGKHTL